MGRDWTEWEHLQRLRQYQRTLGHDRKLSNTFMRCGEAASPAVELQVHARRELVKDEGGYAGFGVDDLRSAWSGLCLCGQLSCFFCSRNRSLVTAYNLNAVNAWITGKLPAKWPPVIAAVFQRTLGGRGLFSTFTVQGDPEATFSDRLDLWAAVTKRLGHAKVKKQMRAVGGLGMFFSIDDTLSRADAGYWHRHVAPHGMIWVAKGATVEDVAGALRRYVIPVIERETGREVIASELAVKVEEARDVTRAVGYSAGALVDPLLMEIVGVSKRSKRYGEGRTYNVEEAIHDLASGKAAKDGREKLLRDWYRERDAALFGRPRYRVLSWVPGMQAVWKKVGLAVDDYPATDSGLRLMQSMGNRSRLRHIESRPGVNVATGQAVYVERILRSDDRRVKRALLEVGWQKVYGKLIESGLWPFIRQDSALLHRAEQIAEGIVYQAGVVATEEADGPGWTLGAVDDGPLDAFIERVGRMEGA